MTGNIPQSGPEDGPHSHHATAGTTQHSGHGAEPRSSARQGQGHGGHAGHKWMMIACCVPMLAIAIALVVSGTASAGLIVLALGCTLMMVLMMGGMGGHGHGGGSGK